MAILKGFTQEPQLGDKEKIAQDNVDYNKPLDKSLDEQKQELKDSIFGSFKNPEDLVDSSLSITEEQVQTAHHKNVEDFSDTSIEKDFLQSKALEENKYFPLVNRLYESGQLSNDSFESIKTEIFNNNGEFDIKNISMPTENKELLEGLMANLEGENREQNILDLGKDIKNLEEFADFNLELTTDGKFESNVLNDIGKNYIKIPDVGNNINAKADISTAIESTGANILKKIKNIPKDSQTYKTAMVNIDSGNLKLQLEGIKSLHTLAYSGEGKLAKKEVNTHKEKRKKELISTANDLEKQIQIALDQGKQEEFKKLDKQKDVIISEVKELVKGDIFEAGEIDTFAENDPLSALEQA